MRKCAQGKGAREVELLHRSTLKEPNVVSIPNFWPRDHATTISRAAKNTCGSYFSNLLGSRALKTARHAVDGLARDDNSFPHASVELLIKLTQIKATAQNPGGEF